MFEFHFRPVQMIPMENLELDERFNREIVKYTIAAIDKAPDPDKFGVISVASMNGHGKFAIYDGGHRYTWLHESGYTGVVPCAVGAVTDEKEIALKFVEMQHDRRDVSPWERYRKLLFAGVPEYVATDRAVEGVGWHVGPRTADGVVMPNPLHRLFLKGQEEGISETLAFAQELWNGRFKATDGDLLIGLYEFLANNDNVDKGRFVGKFETIQPADLLARARERRAKERGTMARNVSREIARIYRSRESA